MFAKKVVPLPRNTEKMENESELNPKKERAKVIFKKIGKVLVNKYVLTVLVFVVIWCIGDKGIPARIHRARQIRELQEELESYQQKIDRYEQDLEVLQSGPQSIERFAREKYYMHADDEDVFLIEEPE